MTSPFKDIKYPDDVLELLSLQVRGTVFDVFRLVWNKRLKGGLKKAELALEGNFSRRKYDDAILVLEAAQFIFAEEEGRSIKYYPTARGKQLYDYFKEKKIEEEAE